MKQSLLILALAGSLALGQALSIENSDPQKMVKVTNRNSGPSYDIDLMASNNNNNNDQDPNQSEVERRRLPAENGEDFMARPPPPAAEADNDERPQIGHITIRRIFLVPMMPPRQESSEDSSNESGAVATSGPMRSPLWPLLMGGAPMLPSESEEQPRMRHHHLLGGDQASRPPTPTMNNGGELTGLGTSLVDPIRMMLELMHQAIAERLNNTDNLMPRPDEEKTTDLKKEATTSGNEAQPVALDKKRQSQNETKEEIVEIEGKKYLKKSVLNKHVGENIIFMTRRLIFVPLNETDLSGETATKTTVEPKAGEQETTSTTTTTTTARESSSTVAPVAEQTTTPTTTTPEQPVEPTSRVDLVEKEEPAATTTTVASTTSDATPSLVERVSEAVEKAAERLVEKAKEEMMKTSTEKAPASTVATVVA